MRPVIQKQPRYEDKALTRLARDIPCQFTFPHECSTDTMACHPNWQEWGKGVGLKCSDFLWASGCLTAHREIDGKVGATMDKDLRTHYWIEAYVSTWNHIWENELVRVA